MSFPVKENKHLQNSIMMCVKFSICTGPAWEQHRKSFHCEKGLWLALDVYRLDDDTVLLKYESF